MIVKKLRCDICGAEVEFLHNDVKAYERLEYPKGWTIIHVTQPGTVYEKIEDCVPPKYADFEVCPKHGLVEIDIEELTVSED